MRVCACLRHLHMPPPLLVPSRSSPLLYERARKASALDVRLRMRRTGKALHAHPRSTVRRDDATLGRPSSMPRRAAAAHALRIAPSPWLLAGADDTENAANPAIAAAATPAATAFRRTKPVNCALPQDSPHRRKRIRSVLAIGT